jgi:hemoglobin
MESFYHKLGEDRLKILIEKFYDKIFQNKLLKPLFLETPKDEIKYKQKLFLTQLLGGPAEYTKEMGTPKMRRRHMPHKITVEVKDEWLKCMQESIHELEWDEQSKLALYSIFPKLAGHMVNS